MLHDLYTPQGQALASSPVTQPWTSYPRPQLVRKNWANLNGWWDFAVSTVAALPQKYDKKIRVPFAPESLLSGIHEHFPEGSYLFYFRKLPATISPVGGRVLLHIGAADQITDVFINGQEAGHHEGGYEAMTFDITRYLKDDNELVIRVQDDLRGNVFPYGKQTMKRGGMWYTPVSGIWQTVWLEVVPENYIHSLTVDATPERVIISTEGYLGGGTVTIEDPEGTVSLALTDGVAQYIPQTPRLWCPNDPWLYRFTVRTPEDQVDSYFAIRTLSIETVEGYPRLCLNGKPYFFHGLLDQGYWSDGLFTPADPSCYEWDILAMKKLGFNTLRKHIKVEPEQFYYDCDRLGMIVFQDMVNNGSYSFLRDTALPTIGLQKLGDKHLHRDLTTRGAFLMGMWSTVRQLKNHPSICYWTIFNEGWGQFDSDNVFEHMRKLDDTRFIDTTSGWFRRKKTQVDSRHIYFRPLKMKAGTKPLVLSEFGGYSFKPEGHVFNDSSTYGYGKYEKLEDFSHAVQALYREQVLPLVKMGLCAAIYTQVSDVEDETNGLVTYDRSVEKLRAEDMLPIAKALEDAIK